MPIALQLSFQFLPVIFEINIVPEFVQHQFRFWKPPAYELYSAYLDIEWKVCNVYAAVYL